MRYSVMMAALLGSVGTAEAAMQHATGSFEVTMAPQPGTGDAIARMTMAKVFAGGLTAWSNGVFLSAGDPASGSAGYVAIERIDGTLEGYAGSFVALQLGTMAGGKPDLRMVVAPGSGTGALAGLTGTMTIRMDAGQHFYTIDYDLP